LGQQIRDRFEGESLGDLEVRVFLRKGVFGSQSALSPQREFVLLLGDR
jgi:hypothetical protein